MNGKRALDREPNYNSDHAIQQSVKRLIGETGTIIVNTPFHSHQQELSQNQTNKQTEVVAFTKKFLTQQGHEDLMELEVEYVLRLASRNTQTFNNIPADACGAFVLWFLYTSLPEKKISSDKVYRHLESFAATDFSHLEGNVRPVIKLLNQLHDFVISIVEGQDQEFTPFKLARNSLSILISERTDMCDFFECQNNIMNILVETGENLEFRRDFSRLCWLLFLNFRGNIEH
ncbi:hypothetical protein HK100_004092 [Physocladia obscura]|uniref:Uncharacterized protein n=1 Tax=Physocladia obscura TaxID=109957 RepID=A0AAD5SZ40_9FUNG|nr:hypothetical protein HK100_004092 [Physocladia obscura]